jgi:hypothetical protein
MSSPAKRKGTRWESAVRDFLREFPILKHARRVAAEGRLDIGDVHAWPFCLQCKNQRSFDLAGWVRDAETQASQAEFPYGVAVVKAPGKGTERGYAVMSLATFRRLAADHLESSGRISDS